MADNTLSTEEVVGVRVVSPRKSKKNPDAVRRIGKVRACVFHPQDKRCVGFLVKRPDLLWMFRRKDVFVAIDGFTVRDGRIVIKTDMDSMDRSACKRLGINWDDCVLWVGLPVMCMDGTAFGDVGDVIFDRKTGNVISLEVSKGAAANALLGTRSVPADAIRGFKRGIGAALKTPDVPDDDENIERGAILVDDSVKETDTEGGLAAKAGATTAIVVDKAQETIKSVKPVVKDATKAAGKAVNKGAYATGRQIGRAKGMFAGFKEEYDKASGKKPATSGSTKKAAASKKATEASSKKTASASASAKKSAAKAPVEKKPYDSVVQGDEDIELVYVDEDGNEIEYVDEEGNRIIFVDEDGNPVDENGNPLADA